MYEIFERLLKVRGVTAYRVSKETGISTATLTDWKKGRSQPKAGKLQQIADFLGVSIDYLMTGKDKEKAPTPEGERRIADKDIMFAFWGGDSAEMDKEDLEDVRRYAEFVRQRKKDKK